MNNKLKKVYDVFLSGQSLNLPNLWSMGLRNEDLRLFVQKGYISKTGLANYTLNDPDFIFEYGCILTENKDYYRAKKCFLKCLEMNPFHEGAITRMILDLIALDRYDEILPLLSRLAVSKEDRVRANYNFFLFLLSYAIELPYEYRTIVKNMQIDDILLPNDSQNKETEESNEIRRLAFAQDFYTAVVNFSNEIEGKYLPAEGAIIIDLLIRARKNKKESFHRLINALRTFNIRIARNLLAKEESVHNLTNSKKMLLLLCNDIISMQETQVPSAPIAGESEDIFRLVCLKQYEKALHNSLIFYQDDLAKPQTEELNRLLASASRLQRDLTAQSKRMGNTRGSFDDIKESILKSLQAEDWPLAFELVRIHLASRGHEKYSYIVENLIRLSYILKSPSVMSPLATMNQIVAGDYRIDSYHYIELIDDCLKENRISEAKIYFETLSRALLEGHTDLPPEELHDIFSSLRCRLKTKSSADCPKTLTNRPIDNSRTKPKIAI